MNYVIHAFSTLFRENKSIQSLYFLEWSKTLYCETLTGAPFIGFLRSVN